MRKDLKISLKIKMAQNSNIILIYLLQLIKMDNIKLLHNTINKILVGMLKK